MDIYDLVFLCIVLFFFIMLVRTIFRFTSGGTFSLVSIFVCFLGLSSVAYLYANKELTVKTFNIFKDMFVKSVESKSSLELAIWFMILVLIMTTPARRSS